MKIRHKLTLRYTGITAAVFSLFVLAVSLFSEQSREKEFFRGLTREAVTKTNLFFSASVDPQTMQSIYRNNRQFIDEVEVAIYTPGFQLLYHDAQEIDIIHETPELIQAAIQHNTLEFYVNDYQGIAMMYTHKGTDYVVTAAAYDGYGYTKRKNLTTLLIALWLSGLVVLAALGYLLARGALRPVSKIVADVDVISESNLNTRLAVKKEHDELDELAETFNRMLDRLEKSFSNQKMFVSNAAHELRTPLAALITELEVALLREHRAGDEYKTMITHALDDAKSLNNLISGLLDLAKANYDFSQIATDKLRLDELLLDAREMVLKARKDYSVELIFEQDAEEDHLITVKGNEYLLKTAFVNLIENNCKFSDNKSSLIRISSHRKNAVVRFSDTGIGIPSEDMENVFTPFFRGSNSVRTKGQGIGMALTQRIIHLHTGTITIQSQEGKGTTFVIEIPHV